MRPIALTGGIGSGKSTVADALRQRGAFVIDADVLAREVVEPGTPGFRAVVERFGESVVAPDRTLDRAALAACVFSDPEARQALEKITHPLVAERARSLFAQAPAGVPIIYEIPLLAESERTEDWAAVVVVDAPDQIRLDRLIARGMSKTDALARMATQAAREERLRFADHVIDNDGSLANLEAQVDRLWPILVALT